MTSSFSRASLAARIAPLLLACASGVVHAAGEWEAEFSLENRLFFEGGRWPGQSADHHNLSASIQPQYTNYWLNETLSFMGTGFLRTDEMDPERNHGDLREFYLRYRARHYELRAGLRRVFWGVTEAAHLVDIVNQSDLLENIDGEDKLGQPMVNGALIIGSGALDVFVLPYFREREFPGETGRLRPFLPVAEDRAVFEDADERQHVDYAARLAQSLGGWDLGLSYFTGTGRDPRLLFAVDEVVVSGEPPPECALTQLPQPLPVLLGALIPDCESFFTVSPVNPHLVPAYDQIEQIGIEVQKLAEGWFFKLEGIYRNSAAQEYWAATGGIEYTFGGVFESALDVTAVAEYLYDDRGALDADSAQARAIRKFIAGESFTVPEARELQTLRPTFHSPFQNDVFAGARIALNDEQSTEMLVGGIVDARSGATLVSLEGSRRLSGDWKLAFELRGFLDIPETDPLYSFGSDSYLQVELVRYF